MDEPIVRRTERSLADEYLAALDALLVAEEALERAREQVEETASRRHDLELRVQMELEPGAHVCGDRVVLVGAHLGSVQVYPVAGTVGLRQGAME